MRALPALPPGLRAAVVVAATSLFMVLVAWATLIGPDEFFTGPGPRPSTVTTTPDSCIPLPVATASDGSTYDVIPDDYEERDYCDPRDTSVYDARRMAERAEPPLWLKVLAWTFQVVVLLGALAALAWLVSTVVRAIGARSRSAGERTDVDFATLAEPVRVEEQILADAEVQESVLRDGEPRNAIVAAWQRFEVQGERAGVQRRASETSSEYAIRILDLGGADAGPVDELARLYREARFSEHPITEEHRSAALAALAGIRRGMGVRP
jgi:hypothetical protein